MSNFIQYQNEYMAARHGGKDWGTSGCTKGIEQSAFLSFFYAAARCIADWF